MPTKQLTKRDFVQLEHRELKCTFVTAKVWVCVYAMSLYQETVFFHKVLAVTVLFLGHRKWPQVLYGGTASRSHASWNWRVVFPRRDDALGQKKSPTQIIASNKRNNGEMYKSLRRMQHQISSVDPAEETYSSEERRCYCYLRLCVGTWHHKEYGKKGKTVSERTPCLDSPLCFPFRLYQEGCSLTLCQICTPAGGEKEAERGLCMRHLLHQVLMLLQAREGNPGNSLSQSISCSCFPSRCPSPAVQGHISRPGRGGVGHPPSPRHASALAPRWQRGCGSSGRGGKAGGQMLGGQQWGQGTPSARAVLVGQAPTTETGNYSCTAGGWVYLADERKCSLQTPVNLQQALSPIQKVA